MKNKQTMYIMRGLPGSGKSTRAKQIAQDTNAVICSADDFFLNDAGEYVFDAANLHKAHLTCQKKADVAVYEGKNVVIDNTNIKLRDMKFYVDLAKQNNIEIEYVEPTTSWAWNVEECFVRNTHKVPKDVISRMKSTYQKVS